MSEDIIKKDNIESEIVIINDFLDIVAEGVLSSNPAFLCGVKFFKSLSFRAILREYEKYKQKAVLDEKDKLKELLRSTVNAYMNLAEKNGWDVRDYDKENVIGYVESITKGVLEYTLSEYESKKIKLYGDFLGAVVYHGDFSRIDELIYGLKVFSKLSYRQLILVKLITDNFAEIDKPTSITNVSICVEMNELMLMGFWRINGVLLETDYTSPITIGDVNCTQYAKEFVTYTNLNFSHEEIQIIVDKFHLDYREQPNSFMLTVSNDPVSGEPPQQNNC